MLQYLTDGSTNFKSSFFRWLLISVLLFSVIYYARAFLIPFAFGALIATVLVTPSNALQKKKIPNGLAVLICMLVLLLIVGSLFSIILWKVSEISTGLVLLKAKSSDIINQVQVFIFDKLGISSSQQSTILIKEQPSYFGIAQYFFATLSNVFTQSIIAFTYIFLLLYYKSHIKKFIIKIAGTKMDDKIGIEILVTSAANISKNYLLGLFKMIVCLWIMYGIGFSILGVKNAIFFAILCGLLEIIPFVGNITGTIITLAAALISGAQPALLVGIVITYATVQFIQGWFLEPFILGPQVKINPLFTIIALIIGQLLWGIPGIILAIPLTAIFKIICDHYTPLNAIGFLIGSVEKKSK